MGERKPRSAKPESPEYAAFTRRILNGFVRRAEDGDVQALVELHALREQITDCEVRAIHALRNQPTPYTWAEIGRWLGMSRQGALMLAQRIAGVTAGLPRFRPPAEAVAVDLDVRTNATADDTPADWPADS